MADIKIDEFKYYTFLNMVKSFIEEVENADKAIELKEKSDVIIKYIDDEFELRQDMLERKAYYDFFITNRYSKPEEANSAYRKYKEINHKLKNRKSLNPK